MARVWGSGCNTLMAAAKSSVAAAATATGTSVSRRAGISKPSPVSPALGAFLGVSEVSRTDAIKKIWQYIKLNDLQNSSNKREIICDEKLKAIFDGKERVGFLEIAKFLKQHFVESR